MFRAEADGRELTFDLAGLIGSNFVMKDQQTGSRWQQATGECFEGPMKGRKLEPYPFLITTWGEWRRRHPGTLALVPKAEYRENFDFMAGMLERQRRGEMTFTRGILREDDRLPTHEQVIGLELGAAHKAYPLARLQQEEVIQDQVGGEPVVLVYDARNEMTTAFSRRLEGRVLEFNVLAPPSAGQESAPVQLVDPETGSVFNNYGECVRGPLEGKELEPLTPLPSFWFSWAEFFPETEIYGSS